MSSSLIKYVELVAYILHGKFACEVVFVRITLIDGEC